MVTLVSLAVVDVEVTVRTLRGGDTRTEETLLASRHPDITLII